MTYDELTKLVPEGAIEANNSGELVIYTGLRIDPLDDDGPLIPFECPECAGEEPDDNEHECPNRWHVENRETFADA